MKRRAKPFEWSMFFLANVAMGVPSAVWVYHQHNAEMWIVWALFVTVFCGWMFDRFIQSAPKPPEPHVQVFHVDLIDELRRHQMRGVQLHDQLKAHIHACCELLGIDPEHDTWQAELVKSIVEHGEDPVEVLSKLDEKPAGRWL